MFDKIIGNDRVKEVFKRLINLERVPNSLLLAGEESVGKKQFAFELAKSFLCQKPLNSESCGECQTCKRAAKFNFPKSDDRDAHKQVIFSEHADLGLVIPYNRNILVDAIRDLEKEANFRPYEAKKRFFIIDEADKMNDAASNALLKTLEEPPATSFIFLITSRPDSLLQTIRSRCQIIRFAPVEAKKIEEHLLSTQKFSPTDAGLLSKISRGSVGRAIETDLEKFRAGREAMLKVLESLFFREDRALLLQIAEEISDAKYKDEFESRLETLQTLIHDIWSLHLGKEEENLVNSDVFAELEKFARNSDSKKLSSWMNEIETLRENLNINLNRKIATDALFMQMASQ
jgi:DNA polymerase-3 subunit delta'